jgi:hypothetical protein
MSYLKLIRVNTWSYGKLSAKIRADLRAVVAKHIARIAADIRASMRQPKSGRIYYYRGKRIRASAPGESPAIRSGRLYRNITPIVSNGGMQATINPRAKGVYYSVFLEEGTSKMAPRPHLKPFFNRRREAFLAETRARLAKSLGSR